MKSNKKLPCLKNLHGCANNTCCANKLWVSGQQHPFVLHIASLWHSFCNFSKKKLQTNRYQFNCWCYSYFWFICFLGSSKGFVFLFLFFLLLSSPLVFLPTHSISFGSWYTCVFPDVKLVLPARLFFLTNSLQSPIWGYQSGSSDKFQASFNKY